MSRHDRLQVVHIVRATDDHHIVIAAAMAEKGLQQRRSHLVHDFNIARQIGVDRCPVFIEDIHREKREEETIFAQRKQHGAGAGESRTEPWMGHTVVDEQNSSWTCIMRTMYSRSQNGIQIRSQMSLEKSRMTGRKDLLMTCLKFHGRRGARAGKLVVQ